MTAVEAKALLDATADDRLAALWRLALVTGLRVGELLALSWADIDTEGRTVTVTARLARLNGEWVRAETKAARELQTIAIDAGTAGLLDTHRIRQAAERRPDWAYWGLVFVTPTGQPFDRHTVMEAFRDACDRAGIERRRVHDIRHGNATIMRDLGIDRETRKARHGHSTDEMDARYSGPSRAQDRAAVERLAEAIG
jgi:integrase